MDFLGDYKVVFLNGLVHILTALVDNATDYKGGVLVHKCADIGEQADDNICHYIGGDNIVFACLNAL